MFYSGDYIKSGRNMVLFTYSTSHLQIKDKVRFYYALKGRDGVSGIMKSMKVLQLGKTVLMVEPKYDEELSQFLTLWNLPFTRRKVIIDIETTRGGLP